MFPSFDIQRKQAENEYNELKKQLEHLQMIIEQERKNPTSEYDESIEKQQKFNETLRIQVHANGTYSLPFQKKNPFFFFFFLIESNTILIDTQVAEAKENLKSLSQSLKTLRSCRKDCNIHMRDLIIDYNCITKVLEISY